MSGFLDEMAQSSRVRVARAAAREPLTDLRARSLAAPAAPALACGEAFDLIAEYKKRSPSLGELADHGGLTDRVTAYASGGAIAVSVLTEPTQFRGDLAHLVEASAALVPLGIPVLRKDFLVDPYQLYESRASGAGGVLLIVRMLSDGQLREMLDCAAELKLFVLLEAFDADDIQRATNGIRRWHSHDRGAPALIGVNCRDLQTLEIAPRRFRELANLLPADLPRVAESGILTPDDCADVVRSGYGMALIGSALMAAAEPAAIIRTMLTAARAAARAAA